MVSANETTDFTVKVDATGLQPDTRYYFAFASGQQSAGLVKNQRCTVKIQKSTQPVSYCANPYANIMRLDLRVVSQC